jgi:hypothetical protein
MNTFLFPPRPPGLYLRLKCLLLKLQSVHRQKFSMSDPTTCAPSTKLSPLRGLQYFLNNARQNFYVSTVMTIYAEVCASSKRGDKRCSFYFSRDDLTDETVRLIMNIS